MNSLKHFIKKIVTYCFSTVELWNKNRFVKKLDKDGYVHKTVNAKGAAVSGNIKIEEHVKLVDAQVRGDVSIGRNSFLRNTAVSGNVNIGEYVRLLGPMTIKGISKVIVGNNTSLNGPNFDIRAQLNEVHIGNFCSIARNTSFQEFNHLYKRATTYFIHKNIFNEPVEKDIYSNGDIEVGHDVWIGAGCMILSGAKIGSGAIIAANSVVSKEIPPYAIAGGNPAKVIKYRFTQDLIDELLSIEWWHWTHKRLKQNKHLFEGELTMDKLKRIR